MSADLDQATVRKSRNVALAIASAGILAILAPWLTGVLGLPIRYEFLFYLMSLAAFVWSFVNIYQIWRSGRNNQG